MKNGQTKYAGGNWAYNPDTNAVENEATFICDLTGCWSKEDMAATGKLLAASKDLLEAAKLALAAILPHFEDDDDGSPEAQASNALLAAIQRAEGE